MTDIVERLRTIPRSGSEIGHTWNLCDEAADEIEKLRAALRKIEYLDRAQVRGQPRRLSIQEIARAALGEKE